MFVWVVFTTQSKKDFEDKINSLPSYVMFEKTTRFLQSGDWPNYTIIYWKKD